MTRAGALPHRVDLLPRDLTGRDARNNEAPAAAPELTNIPARVDTPDTSEDTLDRDRRLDRIIVTIPAYWPRGVELNLDSSGAIRYRGNVYELTGPAARSDDHAGRPDHYELEAERIVG